MTPFGPAVAPIPPADTPEAASVSGVGADHDDPSPEDDATAGPPRTPARRPAQTARSRLPTRTRSAAGLTTCQFAATTVGWPESAPLGEIACCTTSALAPPPRTHSTCSVPSAVRASPGVAAVALPDWMRVQLPGPPAPVVAGTSKSPTPATSVAHLNIARDASCRMPDLPRGTVTFLFTDVEGSTRLLGEHGDDYAGLLADHRRLLRDAFTARGGVEVDTQGDAFFVAFARASDAAAAALEGRRALAPTPPRGPLGLPTGRPPVTDRGH